LKLQLQAGSAASDDAIESNFSSTQYAPTRLALTALDALRRNFTFCEISMLACLRNKHEDKCNRSRVRLACFLLVCGLQSVDWDSARLSRRSDFLPITEQAMTITPIVFILIILLFGFNSTGQVDTRRQTQ
jgi:hypothetical protein